MGSTIFLVIYGLNYWINMEKNQITETELFFEIKEILDNSYSSDEDRNGNMVLTFDSYKAAEDIVFLLKTNFLTETKK